MEKEKVTEKLVRQNGNQAAAVMADYAGQGGGGGTSGIPTIDKNIQPNIVWREPTEADLAKFHASSRIVQVADLPEGKLPLLLVSKYTEDDVEYVLVQGVASVEPSESGKDTSVTMCDGSHGLSLTDDWSLLGMWGAS